MSRQSSTAAASADTLSPGATVFLEIENVAVENAIQGYQSPIEDKEQQVFPLTAAGSKDRTLTAAGGENRTESDSASKPEQSRLLSSQSSMSSDATGSEDNELVKYRRVDRKENVKFIPFFLPGRMLHIQKPA